MFRTYLNRSREVILLYLILIFSIVLLLLVAWLVNDKFGETDLNLRRVNQGHIVVNNINDVKNSVQTTGSAVRSYLIVRDVPHFTKLPEFHKQITEKLDEIKGRIANDPRQNLVMDSLRRNIDNRFAIWDQLINVSKDSLEVVNDQLTLKSAALMRDILEESDEIRNYENGVIETYINNMEAGIRLTSIVALATTLLCVAIIIFALFKLNAEIRHSVSMQAELKTKVLALDRTNADLERFAYVASHDLHDPLRKLFAFSEILMEREKDNLSPDGREIITRMHTFVTRMQRLIDDLLEFSLNVNKVQKKPVDLNQVLTNAKTNLAVNILKSRAVIESETLPNGIIGFESQLNQLFQNIISNSIKYAKSEIPPVIKINTTTVTGSTIADVRADDVKRKFYKIVIADNGIGFDNKYKEKIFVIFQRLHGKSEYEGTGIGLATCVRVVENHGGYISATGVENDGAEFTIYFPVA